MKKEGAPNYLIPLSVIGLYAVAFCGFGDKIKNKVKEEQGGRCAQCGSTKHLQCHHKLPKALGGSDDISNAVYLCGETSNDCHDEWDSLAFQQHIIYPGIPMSEATDAQRNPNYKPKKKRKRGR
jgi:hypothetical protein